MCIIHFSLILSLPSNCDDCLITHTHIHMLSCFCFHMLLYVHLLFTLCFKTLFSGSPSHPWGPSKVYQLFLWRGGVHAPCAGCSQLRHTPSQMAASYPSWGTLESLGVGVGSVQTSGYWRTLKSNTSGYKYEPAQKRSWHLVCDYFKVTSYTSGAQWSVGVLVTSRLLLW